MRDDREAAPDPARARDVAEFVEALRQLRSWAGGPPFRMLAKRVGPMLRPPRDLTHSTLSDLFRADRRRLDLDMVIATVRALGVPEQDVARWRSACVRAQGGTGFGAPADRRHFARLDASSLRNVE